MKAIVNGRILLPDREETGKALLFDEKIVGLTDPAEVPCDEIINAGGAYVSPGLIDTHIHGYRGADASDGEPDGLRRMAEQLTENGVTAFLPTTMTVSGEEIRKAFRTIRYMKDESRKPGFRGAEILGCHAEGPFINPTRKGAQAEDNICLPDAGMMLEFRDVVRILTFAPEMPGAVRMMDTIRRKSGMVLSIGHTDADYDQTLQAMQRGAARFTHLFNAMPPLHHRHPGPVGAALASNAWTELIADGFHVHPGLFSMLHRVKGNRLVLITDCVRAGGMPDGEYTLGGQLFSLQGVACRMRDGTIAGSVLRLNRAVKQYRDAAEIPMHEAVRAASLNAAESVGLENTKGSLLPGRDADITIMNENCDVICTIVRGRICYGLKKI